MKIKYWLVIMSVIAFQGIAHAEMIMGTVTNIDPSSQKVTVRRANDNAELTIHVKDGSVLSGLAAGSQVEVDAKKAFWGKWEAQSLNPVTPAATAPSQASASNSPAAPAPSPSTETPAAGNSAIAPAGSSAAANTANGSAAGTPQGSNTNN